MHNIIPIIKFSDIVIAKGKGSYIYDNDGKKYLDITSGQLCTIFGHSNKVLKRVLINNSNRIQNTNTEMLTDATIKAANSLAEIAKPLDISSITLTTGAEANEFALRFAKDIKKKNGVISFTKGYGGLSLGAQTITYGGIYTNPKVDNVYSVDIPCDTDDYNMVKNKIDQFEDICKKYHSNIAIAVFEPIASVGGMIIPPKLYFMEIAKICKKYDIFLCFDECQTGYGRTGKWFYYQEIGIEPDMVVIGKGLGLGLPVSAVFFNNKTVDFSKISISHYSSHQNDPFAADIIVAGINYITKNNILKNVADKGKYFLNELEKLSKDDNLFINPRGRGLMIGLDLHFVGIDDYRELFIQLKNECLENGLIIQGCNAGKTLRFLPSYLIKREEIDECINILRSASNKLRMI
jgi:2,2-dialkylglycine decarboxylase (pyruvate)